MKSYQVSGVIQALVFVNIQAETEDEAKEKFENEVKKIIDKKGYCDWIEPYKQSMDVEEIDD